MGLVPPEQIEAYMQAQRLGVAMKPATLLERTLRLDPVTAQAFTQKGIDLAAAATTDAGDLTTGTLDPARLGVTAGTTTASRPLVVDTNKRLDELVLGTLKLGAGAGTAVAATAAELNKVAGVTDGTAAANKAVVLGAGKQIDTWETTGALTAGGTFTANGTAVVGGALDHNGTTAGFFGAAPVSQQDVDAVVNNVTAPGAPGTLTDYTPSTYAADASAIYELFKQLARAVAQLNTSVRNLGLGA